jgi:hypothetical protein
VAASIEENSFVAAFHSQNVLAMMRFVSAQGERIGVPVFWRDIKAMHWQRP